MMDIAPPSREETPLEMSLKIASQVVAQKVCLIHVHVPAHGHRTNSGLYNKGWAERDRKENDGDLGVQRNYNYNYGLECVQDQCPDSACALKCHFVVFLL